jgi:predicted HTH domain antitoxin
MEAVNVSGLKNNPTEALRKARKDMVVVMNRDHPEALMVGIESSGLLDGQGVRLALATALFRDGNLSLARSARLAAISLAEFITHLSRLGIPVVRLDADETSRDMETLEAWLALS